MTFLGFIAGYCLLFSVSCLKWEIGWMELPTHLLKPAYATINQETLYIFGGYDDFIDEYSYFIYKYNIQRNEWTTLPVRTPTKIQCYTCTAIINQTLIYIFTEYVNTIYIFDTVENEFINKYISEPVHPIEGDSLSVTNDIHHRYIYVVSYVSIANQTYLQIYDSTTNFWCKSLAVPYLSYGYTSVVSYHNTIILFGGYFQQTNQNSVCVVYLDCICKYKMIQQQWECYSNSTLSDKKYGSSTVVDYNKNLIYIIGGFGGGQVFSNKVDVFDPITNSIRNDTRLPNIGGNNMIATNLQNKIVIFGGWNRSTYSIVKTSLIANLLSEELAIDPTVYPTLYPSTYPTRITTTEVNRDTNVSKISNSLQNTFTSSSKFDNTHLKLICITSASIVGALLLFCVVYLLFFTAQRSKEIGQISMILFIKHCSISFKISILFCILDSVSDYIFATSLIQSTHNSKSNITLIAWISLICGIVGLLLCFCWLLVARKLYAKIPILIEKLMQYQQIKESSRSLNMNLCTDILKEIRVRKVDIDIFGLLIACLDIAQITIIVIVAEFFMQKWTTISSISLLLCIISCTLKFFNIIVDIMGCNDESLAVKNDNKYDHENKPIHHNEDSDIDNVGHAAYERHISIIRNNVDESDEMSENDNLKVIQIHRNDDTDQQDINTIIANAAVVMGLSSDEDETPHNRHIFLNGEESHSFPGSYNINNGRSPCYIGNVIDL